MRCGDCGSQLEKGASRCRSCGAFNFVTERTGKLVYLSNVPETSLKRVPSALMNHCLGGGYVLGTSILLGGLRGAGKSTMSLQECAGIQDHRDGDAVYIAGEETAGQIRSRAIRLGIPSTKLDRIGVIEAMGSGLDCLESLQMIKTPSLVIADSIPGIVGEGQSAQEHALAFAKALNLYAKKRNTICLLLDHVTKDGDFAGLMTIQHEVDALVSLFPDEKDPTVVTLRTEKNRHGRSFVETFYDMAEDGLHIIEEMDPREGRQKSGKTPK